MRPGTYYQTFPFRGGVGDVEGSKEKGEAYWTVEDLFLTTNQL